MFWDISHTIYRKNIILSLRYIEVGGTEMNAKEAVALRIQILCSEHSWTVNGLANECGVPPSTIYSMLNTKSKNPGVVSIQKICDGLGISVREFFDTPLFENLEQEIK